jgi:NMD protein affecting ribosome stability and mRNA decay
MKPVEKDLAQIKSVVAQLKSKKITAITISSFADEKSGVNFKSVAQTRANVVAAMIKKANPKIKY